jgi:hypothetical protein
MPELQWHELDKAEWDNLLTYGVGAVAWDVFGRWLDHWRARHPDDQRSDLELTEVYAAQERSGTTC